METLLLPFILLGLLLLAACGGNDEDPSSFGPAGLPGRADSATESQAYPAAAAAPAAISAPAAPAPAPPRAAAEAKDESAGASASLLQISNSGTDEDIALVSQQRIIVRTVDMGLVVDDVPAALDDIAALAEELETRGKRRKNAPTLRLRAHEHSILAGAIGAALIAAFRYQQLEERGRLEEIVGAAAAPA